VPEEEAKRRNRRWEDLQRAMGGHLRRDCTVGVLSLREDGWAKLVPKYEHGLVYTRQFVFEGATLEINADCSGGYVQVGALDPYFRPYPGFSAEECDPVFNESQAQIWHTVRWHGNSDVRSLWNKPVRLCLHLHQASAYGFQFQHTSQRVDPE